MPPSPGAHATQCHASRSCTPSPSRYQATEAQRLGARGHPPPAPFRRVRVYRGPPAGRRGSPGRGASVAPRLRPPCPRLLCPVPPRLHPAPDGRVGGGRGPLGREISVSGSTDELGRALNPLWGKVRPGVQWPGAPRTPRGPPRRASPPALGGWRPRHLVAAPGIAPPPRARPFPGDGPCGRRGQPPAGSLSRRPPSRLSSFLPYSSSSSAACCLEGGQTSPP